MKLIGNILLRQSGKGCIYATKACPIREGTGGALQMASRHYHIVCALHNAYRYKLRNKHGKMNEINVLSVSMLWSRFQISVQKIGLLRTLS